MQKRFLCIALLASSALVASRVSGRQTEQWRLEAQERIEQYRMGTLRITVRDESGQPLSGVPVHVLMKRHKFGFGTAVSMAMMTNNQYPQYRQSVENLFGDGRSFNLVVYGNAMKWPQWESSSTHRQQVVTQVLWFYSRGIEVRGHNLIWPAWRWLPGDLEPNEGNPEYIKSRTESRIRSATGYRGIKGMIKDWDVINEPVHLTDLRDVFRGTAGYPTGEEVYAEWFGWAAETDPNARLFVNEYNIINNYTGEAATRLAYRGLIQDLLDSGTPLGGIGIQGHIGGWLPTPEMVYAALEQFASFGLPLVISEYDASHFDEAAAAQFMRDFLTMFFSHPLADSFVMWGFWDGDHWRGDAPIFRDDWSMKPSGEAFIDLVFNAWWTDETVVTDAQGGVEVKGFLGDYEIIADRPSGTVSTRVELGTTGVLDVFMPATSTAVHDDVQLPATVVLEDNYPNPFNPTTTIRYGLPGRSSVRLIVYDQLGRTITTLVDTERPAGWHVVTFDAGGLPSGLYYYRLTSGSTQRTGSMILSK